MVVTTQIVSGFSPPTLPVGVSFDHTQGPRITHAIDATMPQDLHRRTWSSRQLDGATRPPVAPLARGLLADRGTPCGVYWKGEIAVSTVVDEPRAREIAFSVASSDPARAVLAELFGPPANRGFLVHYWNGTVEEPETGAGNRFTISLDRPGALRRMLPLLRSLPHDEVDHVERDAGRTGDGSDSATPRDANEPPCAPTTTSATISLRSGSTAGCLLLRLCSSPRRRASMLPSSPGSTTSAASCGCIRVSGCSTSAAGRRAVT